GTNGAGSSTGTGGRGTSGAPSSGGNRNAGGNAGSLGSGGLDGAGGGATNDSGAGGNSGGAGGTITSTGGATGTAGRQNSGGATACTVLTTFYPDNDQDSFGRSTGTIMACSAPASGNWSAVGGDCDDDAKLVFPKEPTYYDAPHATAGGGGKSFDYDCSGAEEGAPGQPGLAPTCSSLSLLGCSGTGYAPTTRSGPGVNQLCGSTTQVTCKANSLACASVITDVAAYRCK
ncbi:MAG TPA: hypothetical protein VF395_12765, partial [Polyangiaceae bacterium]